MKRIAVVMAGGSGERFWPVSTKERPKQFLNLAHPDSPLLADAVNRAIALTSAEQTYIATVPHLVELSSKTCPNLPGQNILAEPAKRNTTGALAWLAANLIAKHPETWADLSIAIVTADHRIEPIELFRTTVNRAMTAAESNGKIVTIGIKPDRPETGFGYIEVGDTISSFTDEPPVCQVARFREKPNLEIATEFLRSGNFLWNSGMFFFTLTTFMSELQNHQPEIAEKIRDIAGHLAKSDLRSATQVFELLESISIDYALMEVSQNVLVTAADFTWDDLGAWDSIARSYAPDPQGNVALGKTNLIEASNNVIYNESASMTVNILGVNDLAVVITDSQVLVIPKDRAQEVKKFLNS
jgi:mannose-1-phosphate guanylyltransferase